MEISFEFIMENIKWVFSGIGVFIIGLIYSLVKLKRKKEHGDIIATSGNQSPGKVGGDYKVEIKKQK